EPMDRPGRGMGDINVKTHQAHMDDFLTVTDGVPTHVKRTFGALSASRETEEGEVEMPKNPAMPAEGLVVDIQVQEDGSQKITVDEGEAPDNEKFLEHQPLEFALDGLLPPEAVEVDAKWELDNEVIRRALGDLMPAPGPRPEGEGRGRRRDDSARQDGPPRGRRGMGGGGNIGRFLQEAEWTGEATLISIDKEYEGEVCAVIEIKLEAEGDLPENPMGGRGKRGGDRMVNPATATASAPIEGDASVEVKGKLYFSMKNHHPVALKLEGKLETSESNTSERGERTISMHVEREGTFQVEYSYKHETR
ncbi:MAG TPA: hypothetical protein PLJ12_12955, partial [Planctomycetota bacterium]|nr:hypothetical protein [Planctomycetota bacterium]